MLTYQDDSCQNKCVAVLESLDFGTEFNGGSDYTWKNM